MPSDPKLAVAGLKAYYFGDKRPIRAVDDVNFVVSKGDCLAIVGESGCGKSTLGSAIMGSLQSPGRIVEGMITLDGAKLNELSSKEFDEKVRWKKISMVFQGAMNSLDPVYSIMDQMTELLKVHGAKGPYDATVMRSLQSVGLEPEVARLHPHELSGGMKQRVLIAMSLLLEPELLIADEPTTALDVIVQREIIELLQSKRQNDRIAIILITHDLSLVSLIANKIAIMYAGQIVEMASASEIYTSPKHPYTRALISAIPRLRSNEKKLRFIPGRPPDLSSHIEGCRFRDRCPTPRDICRREPPEFKTSNGGYVRCWLYDPDLAAGTESGIASQH
ncbi:MAG: ABC transporter ATP-binding protein [Nitrososphaera sp.]